MKRLGLFLVIFCFVALASIAQEKYTKKIEVRGSAELEIIPDEIFIDIILKEYQNGSKKKSINQLEKELVDAVSKVDIDPKNLAVKNISGYNWNWRKKKSDEFLTSKNFSLKVSNLKLMNDLIEKLDGEGINYINIARYSHSEIEKLKKEVKINAMKAAKMKASYLLAAVDEKLGGVLEVREYETPQYAPQKNRMISNMAMESAVSDYQSDLESQNIKIKAEIIVVFEIL